MMHAMWSASSVMMHALTGVNALLKMFYTTKEIIKNCPKMNRPKKSLFFLCGLCVSSAVSALTYLRQPMKIELLTH
jgi:hypothetical protein